MKVGELVYIGWSGKAQSPFIGMVVKVYRKTSYCWVYVNSKFQWCDFDSIKKVANESR